MNSIWIFSGLATFLAAVSGICLASHGRIRREGLILRAENARLSNEVESLNDRVWVMAASEALHRSLVETLGDLVVRRSSTGRILYANAAYATLLVNTPDALRGQCTAPVILETMPGTCQRDGVRLFDELIRCADGQERWIAWVETVVALDGDDTVLQRVGRDVSGRVAAERHLEDARIRAESASEAKSRFLATVSHEFRTPLNGILGMADLLNDTRLEPEQVAYVKALQSSGKALLGLVDEILDLTKVEAGKIVLKDEVFELPRLIEDVVELMAPRAQTKGLDIAAFIAAGLPRFHRGDEERIRQILVNLLGNAIKFTASGGVALRIGMPPASQGDIIGHGSDRHGSDRHGNEGNAIEISVEDTGSGIPPDRIDAVFLEFEQATPETSRRHGGTGLGLAIVKRLSQAMGGDVTLASDMGKGSVFTVHLPLLATAGNKVDPVARPLHGLGLLIVSSSPYSGQAMASVARAAGADVDVVDGHPASMGETLAAHPWHAVIIDYALGADLAGRWRLAASGAGCRNVLVALSPQERHSLGRPLDAGFTGHLVRPVRARSLLDRLVPGVGMTSPDERPVMAVAGKGLRVLVAEDNEINAMIVLKTLERHGAEAVWARDGRDALVLAEASLRGEIAVFDLVLMDVRMPEMDGLEATRMLRAYEVAVGSAGHLPVIGISANVAPKDVAEARQAGMDDCLSKPLDRAHLLAWLSRVHATKPQSSAA